MFPMSPLPVYDTSGNQIDPGEIEGADTYTLEQLAGSFLSLGQLVQGELSAHMQSVGNCALQMLKGNYQQAMRLIFTFKQLAQLPTWQHQNIHGPFSALEAELWNAAKNHPVCEGDWKENDWWLALMLVRSDCRVDERALSCLTLRDTLVGGWPHADAGANPGTIAHTILMALHGAVEGNAGVTSGYEGVAGAIKYFATLARSNALATFAKGGGTADPCQKPMVLRPAPPSDLDTDAWLLACAFCYKLFMDDEPFMSELWDLTGSSSAARALQHFVDTVVHPIPHDVNDTPRPFLGMGISELDQELLDRSFSISDRIGDWDLEDN
jgi:hypothetical protein